MLSSVLVRLWFLASNSNRIRKFSCSQLGKVTITSHHTEPSTSLEINTVKKSVATLGIYDVVSKEDQQGTIAKEIKAVKISII